MNDKLFKFNFLGSIRIKLVILYMALVFIVMITSGTFIYTQIKNKESENIKIDLEKFVDEAKKNYFSKLFVDNTYDNFIEGDNSDIISIFNNNEDEFAERDVEEFIDKAKKDNFTSLFNNLNSENSSSGVNENEDVISVLDNLTNKEVSPFNMLGGRNLIDICILNVDGFPVAPEEIAYRKHFDDSVIVSAATGKAKYSPWEKDNGKNSDDNERVKVWMKYAAPIFDNDGNVAYILYVAKDAQYTLANFNTVIETLVVAVIIAMILAIIIGVIFSATITGPITSLTKTAKEMAEGNLSQEIPVKSADEIGQLTDSFNNMAISLDTTMKAMSIDKSRIEIILNNMTDGVLAYSSTNKLVHANYASLEMLGIKDIEAIEFQDVMEILKIDVENVINLTKSMLKENTIQIKDKYIALNYSPYSGQGSSIEGVVIVLQDVTKHTKLDNMRKEFVANVSHEIRTPLTTIKTYSETLLEGAIDDKETALKFLDTINDEADRITLLTADLLELSRFDNKQLKMEFEEINLISLIYNSIRQNTVLANKKNQTIIFEPEFSEMFIYCDPSRINQVINNIISNAIKYSLEDTNVTITVSVTSRFFKVFITDEGVGIPKEDLQRIFERFFRVDKARSRAMGGTGLGLAIAKEIMEAHGGNITAISTPNKGTTMVLTFNKVSIS